MTATVVNGHTVIATEPAHSNLSGFGGRGDIHYRQIVKLHLDDKSEVFGCVHCDFTGASPAVVRPHLKRHNPPTATAVKAGVADDYLKATLGELLERSRHADAYLASIERLSADRDHWKQRALAAEKWRRQAQNLFGATQ